MAEIERRIRSLEEEAREKKKRQTAEVLRRRSFMRADLTERFIAEELSIETLPKRVFESKNREVRIEVPNGCHCTGGFERKSEFSALHPLLKKHIRKLSERRFHIEVFNPYNMIETRLGPKGEVTKVYREDPACLLVVCHGRNPYKYMANWGAGLGTAALLGVASFMALFFLVSLPSQLAFMLGVGVFLIATPAVAHIRRRRLNTI